MSKFELLLPKTTNEIVFHLLFQFLISLLLFHSLRKWFSKSAKPNTNPPPSPPKLPILGNLHQLTPLPHRPLRSMARQHGPIMLLRFGSVPTLVISSAAAAREVLKTHDLAFADRPDSSVGRRLLYNNKDISVAPYGDYWRHLKSICVLNLLSNKQARSFHSIREEETGLLVKKIEEAEASGSVNLSRTFAELTYDVVSRSAFGRKYREEKFFEMLKEFLEVLASFSIGDFIPGLWWVNRVNGFDSRVDKAARDMDEFLEGVVRERMDCGEDKKGDNFVDILIEIYQNNSASVPLDRDGIKAIILDVFGGGTDTTATVLEWAMTELLRHPQILKKLQDEVREIVKDKNDISNTDLDQMHYLKAVIKETLRLHTPIPLLIPRVARENVKVMGYDIAAGTMVMINAWAIGRDLASWAEPEKFDPARFLDSSVDYKGLDFELIPFGSGRRGCPGTAFAMATNEFVLANIVQKFDWKLPDDCKDLDMSERPGVAIHKAVPLLAVGTRVHS